MKFNITLTILAIPLVLLFISTVDQIFAEELETIEIEVKYTNGDIADFNSMKVLVYQDFDKTPILEKKLEQNPYVISVPENHRYKIEVYANGMYGSVGYVQLNTSPEKIKINIPITGGLKFNVFYKDGQTPINGATVVIKSHDHVERLRAQTNDQGETIRYWIQSTTKQDEYYIADVYLGEIFAKSKYPIKLQAGLSNDEKIITDIPEIIEDLITITLYENSNKIIDAPKGTIHVILTNIMNNNSISDEVNHRGEAHFSNLKPGTYIAKIKTNNSTEDAFWPERQLQISGKQNHFNIFKIIQNVDNSESKSEVESCNCIAFRFDDIQDYWLNDVQIKVMETFVDKKISITIGIIGDSFGNDLKLVNFINDKNNKRFFEIASHGIGNVPFTEFSKEEQNQKLHQSVQNINDKLDSFPKTFIPPQNRFDENTKQILIDNGFTHLSASILHGDNPPFPLKNETLYRFPEISSTGEFDSKQNIFVGISSNKTLTDAIDGLARYGFAVITLHPQEFSIVNNGTYINEINSEQLLELEKTIKELQERKIRIVSINQIHLDAQNIPSWIKNNAGWWADNQIDDNTFVQGIEYLVKNGIIKVNEKSQSAHSQQNIPSWIKNNAGWWADNQIDDNTFVQGIEYLVKNGIIKY